VADNEVFGISSNKKENQNFVEKTKTKTFVDFSNGVSKHPRCVGKQQTAIRIDYAAKET
jgi:hypothetical protein